MFKFIFNSLFIFLLSLSSYAFCQPKTQEKVQTLEILDKNASLTSFPAEILLDKIYAVHATRCLPDSDYLHAGFSLENCSPLEKAMMPKARHTLHFALGELVRPVEEFMSWEDCPYAVVAPLRVLQSQLININCYDTFILGDLKLTEKIYLVVPNDAAERIESQATVISYDSNTQTLREAVDALILQKGGWHIEMNGDDIEDELHEAYLNGCNINVAEFFAPLKEEVPCLAVGLRFDPLDGEHYRLSQIEMGLLFVSTQILANTYQETGDHYLKSSTLENFSNTVNEHFEIWSSSLTNFDWSNESQEAHNKLAIELTKWKNIAKIELLLRTMYQKTLMSAPSDFLLKISKLLNQPDELQDFIIRSREQLLDYPQEAV